MKLDINKMRHAAGLLTRLVEEKKDASPEHEMKEHELFNKACVDLESVEKMASERLKNPDLSEEHKKQYTDMHACAKKCVAEMKRHVASYKKD